MELPSQTTVLGKRNSTKDADSLVLHLSPTPDPAILLPEQSDPDTPQSSSSKVQHIIVNGLLVPKKKKCYECTFQGCDKSYSKPSRLEEHERSHTGQRPFACETCGKCYLRETHLIAHARSHLPESARPFLCERTGCGKRFWTTQHLRAHASWHDGAKPYKCTEADCHEAFSKHHQLRAHICLEHSPPGTKPYICDHEGCTKSFNTSQHLRTHHKTHDNKRYACSYQSCLPSDDESPQYFPTWSALQSHIRTSHPPVCPHQSCHGKAFANQANLRAHIKLHEERDAEVEIGDVDSGNETDRPPKKKRRGGEHGRDWKCEFVGCDKDFKSKNALSNHTNVTHLGKRDFVCPHTDCDSSFGYKHLLQRHLAKCHAAESSGPDINQDDLSQGEDQEAMFDIDTMTGNAYAKRAEARLKEAKALRCPFPHVQELTRDDLAESLGDSQQPSACDYVFNRSYDLRRHLNAAHDLICSKEIVDTWVRKQKRMTQGTSTL